MGLDSVELVMEFEDEFGLKIPDADAEAMISIGDVIRYIAAQRGVDESDAAGMQDIRHRIFAIVAEQMGVNYAEFVRDLNVG